MKVDLAGNIYIADENDNRIRKVNTAGIITTIAGNGTSGYTGDGFAATAAQLNQPAAIALDATGNVYIADNVNNVIRKVNSSGIISTFAGGGMALGDGGPATTAALSGPYDVATDAHGNLFIADYGHFRVRKVNSSGIITTVAGDGNADFSGDGGPATAAEFGGNIGIGTDKTGNLYIADASNQRIRKVNSGSTAVANYLAKRPAMLAVPNPAKSSITITLQEGINSLYVTDLAGRLIYSSNEQASSHKIDISTWQSGYYLLKVNNSDSNIFLKE